MLTDARFSGVSTGACIGHVGPEALAGGPIGKLRDGDHVRIVIDRNKLEGTIDFVGTCRHNHSTPTRAPANSHRATPPNLPPTRASPDDTRLWAALQRASGGTWGGCVYDVDAIISKLTAD